MKVHEAGNDNLASGLLEDIELFKKIKIVLSVMGHLTDEPVAYATMHTLAYVHLLPFYLSST